MQTVKTSVMKRTLGGVVLCLALSTWASTVNEHADSALAQLTQRIEVKRPPTSAGQSVTQLPDGKWLLAGGLDAAGHPTDQLVIVDRTLANPTALPAVLSTKRTAHSATVLPDGNVLIVGGLDSSGQPLAAVELFKPATLVIEALGDVGLPARSQHTATLLMDGRVLLVGGLDVTALVHRDAQLIDPQTWRVEPVREELVRERYGHHAALLPNDTVAVWAGKDQVQQPVSSAELFDRGTGRFTKLADLKAAPVAAPYASTVPRVAASLPAANAADVSVGSRIAVRFAKPLDPQTLSSASVTLFGPAGPVEASVVAAEGGLLLFVTPKMQLLPGSIYTLFIRDAKDMEARLLPFTAIKFETAVLAKPTPRPAPVTQTMPKNYDLSDVDGELWIPGAQHMRGSWRSGNARLALKQAPKRNLVAKAIHGKADKGGLPSAPPGVTAIAGQVLKLNSRPLANVTLSIGARKVQTDQNGEFLLTDIPAGKQVLMIDGGSASKGKAEYGRYEYRALVEAGKTTALPFVIWMTRLDSANEVSIPSPTQRETVITNPRIPGLELHIPAGTVIRDFDGNIVTEIGMTAIPIDQPPFPLPNSVVPVYFTVQPGGSHLQGLTVNAAKGARLIYPNFSKEPPGKRMDFINYDARDKGWYVYGKGTVSMDGKSVVPDDGVVIYEFTGAMIAQEEQAPPEGAQPETCKKISKRGDPVDCYTGLFEHAATDLFVNDVIPISVSRSYRPRDSLSRAFGIGTNLSYDMFLVGDTFPYTYQDLILSDGGRVHYTRTSSGTSYADAVYRSTSVPGAWFGSTLEWNTAAAGGWLLRLKDGTVFTFPEAFAATARCSSLINIKDRNGNEVKLTRDANCNLTTVLSSNGRHFNFTYDGSNRVTAVSDNSGRTVTYAYDSSGRLTAATDPDSKSEAYTYDSQHRMLTVTDKRGNVMVTNVYDTHGRVSQQTYADSTTSSFAYTLDSNNKVTQTDYTNERGVVSRVQFNSAGYPVSDTEALGKTEQQTTTFSRNSTTNLLSSRTDALGRVTAYQYDSNGNITQLIERPNTIDATTWTYTYDANSPRANVK